MSRIVAKFPNQVFRPTADIILTRGNQILLIERGREPFKGKWALPGGHIEAVDVKSALLSYPNERYAQIATKYAKNCILRETKEEVSIKLDPNSCQQIFTVARDSQIDPRGPTLTYVFHCEVPEGTEIQAGDDAANAKWFFIPDLSDSNMAFDHFKIIVDWIADR